MKLLVVDGNRLLEQFTLTKKQFEKLEVILHQKCDGWESFCKDCVPNPVYIKKIIRKKK